MAARWSVPRAWPGARVFILGGGASLTGFDAGVLRGRGRTIAIKEAGLTMAPWADVLFWSDAWWIDGNRAHDGNRDRLGLHTGSWKIGRSPIQGAGGHDVKILGHDGKAALSESPRGLAGACSGGSAINLAFLFGARGIVLLGYDMQGGNWDGRPRKAALSNRYATHFIPAIERMAPRLRALGVTVINATPGSRLTCFPHRPLEAILDETDSTEDGALPAAPPPRPSPARGEGE